MLSIVLDLFLLPILLALPSETSAQSAAQAPAISYQGLKVSAVELAGRPGLNTRQFQKMIYQPVNEPYSQQKIDETVAALKKTGQFSDVTSVVTPEAEGLKVLIVLHPAVYFGIYDFGKAANRFSYSRLLLTADYPRQEPYTASRVEEARANLLDFFHQNGYFQAAIKSRLQTDKNAVNVFFDVDLGKRAGFGKIILRGVSDEERQQLMGSLQSLMARIKGDYLNTGKPYSMSRLQAATKRLKGKLGSQHYLASQVKIASSNYDPKTNSADVVFDINKGPEVHIKTEGAHVWGHTQKKLIPIYSENAVYPELIREGEQNLTSYFQSKGFFDVEVHSQIDREPSNTTIIYNIEKGKRGEVEDVDFEGNSHFSARVLSSQIDIKQAAWWLPFFSHGDYSEKLLSDSVKRVENLYKNAGYSEVKVTPHLNNKGDLAITFEVEEGPRDMVESLDITGDVSVAVQEFAFQGLNLERGNPYSQKLLNEDRDQIIAAYLDHGYLATAFRARVSTSKNEPHRVRVTYDIEAGPQVHTAAMQILGASDTREATVVRAANIKMGKPLSETSMLAAENELYALGTVDWASVDPLRPVTVQPQAEVMVKLHESKRNTITYGVGFEVIRRGGNVPGGTVALPGGFPVGLPSSFQTSEKTFWGPRGSIQYTRHNFRGRAESITAGVYGARLDQRGSIDWTIPYFWNSSWSSDVTISGERSSENPIFTSRLGRAGFQLQKYIDSHRTESVFLRYNFSRTSLTNLLIPDLVLPEDRSVRLSTISGSFIKDTRDNPLDAHNGVYQSLEIDLNPKALGSNTNYARFLGQAAYYRQIFGGSTVWANSIRFGAEKSFAGAHIPLSESFFSGGGSTLRGFPLNGAGPQRSVQVCSDPSDPSTCSQISVPVGGPQLLILNSELRFPLPIFSKLGGVVFYDGGNVFSHVGFGGFASNYTNSVGFGLRYSTPVGPVRIDIGHLVSPIPGVKATQLFITLGQAF